MDQTNRAIKLGRKAENLIELNHKLGIDEMDMLKFAHSVKESTPRRPLSEEEQLILIFQLSNPWKNIVTMTSASILRHRLLQWVRTGKWPYEYST
jgi:hypothetical protein